MNRLLLDASVLLAAFDPDDANHEAARALLEDGEVGLATLDLARYEVTNVVVRAWRSHEYVEPLLAAIDRLGDDGGVFRSDGGLLARAAEVAERHEISAYGAAYVAAGSETGLRLVSCDERDLVSRGLAALPADARSQNSSTGLQAKSLAVSPISRPTPAGRW